jgi:Tfp pilus assembly protein FimT
MLVAGVVIIVTLLMMFAFPAIDDFISRTDPAVGQ